MTVPVSRFHALSRRDLAALVPELLLCGQLIDRSGMAHCISAFGREGMTQVAIEEWRLASPIYTRRMQLALNYVGDDVITIFKGLQLDIGAPPQFMDFRFRVDDPHHGEFWLDHCGALADVEPMGVHYVKSMCHDIEDPTFDATALATNPHARVRPLHRPPREPADRTPVCAWTVIIDESHTPPPVPPHAERVAGSVAARLPLNDIDRDDTGAADYSGPLLSELRFSDFSHSALVRIAEEVCLQQHLLTLGFVIAVHDRADTDTACDIGRKQFTGVAGIASERIRRRLGLGTDAAALAQVLRAHPALNPHHYTGVEIESDTDVVRVRFPTTAGALTDRTWPAMLAPDHLGPLNAMARGVDARYHGRVVDRTADGWTVELTRADEPFPEAPEVQITRFSTGADFTFADRGIPLPLTVRRPEHPTHTAG
ncbi:hypothetical protein [Nocardia paucivorans]|uniref:hypothetical protein n=1 Tax=Nocardia paucivorans TaxID=114259 RepID=UPI000305EF2A|nr:hypothetical protein [Nocardia paucivorans]